MRYPKIELLSGQDRRLRAGHPWVFSNEIRMDAAAKSIAPGETVCLFAEGKALALAHFGGQFGLRGSRGVGGSVG